MCQQILLWSQHSVKKLGQKTEYERTTEICFLIFMLFFFKEKHEQFIGFLISPLTQLQRIYLLASSCSVAKSGPTLYNPMNCSVPGFPVFYCLLEFAQTHVHYVGDAIQLSHPLSAPSALICFTCRYYCKELLKT